MPTTWATYIQAISITDSGRLSHAASCSVLQPGPQSLWSPHQPQAPAPPPHAYFTPHHRWRGCHRPVSTEASHTLLLIPFKSFKISRGEIWVSVCTWWKASVEPHSPHSGHDCRISELPQTLIAAPCNRQPLTKPTPHGLMSSNPTDDELMTSQVSPSCLWNAQAMEVPSSFWDTLPWLRPSTVVLGPQRDGPTLSQGSTHMYLKMWSYVQSLLSSKLHSTASSHHHPEPRVFIPSSLGTHSSQHPLKVKPGCTQHLRYKVLIL